MFNRVNSAGFFRVEGRALPVVLLSMFEPHCGTSLLAPFNNYFLDMLRLGFEHDIETAEGICQVFEWAIPSTNLAYTLSHLTLSHPSTCSHESEVSVPAEFEAVIASWARINTFDGECFRQNRFKLLRRDTLLQP